MPSLVEQLGIGSIADSDIAHALTEQFGSAVQDGDDVVYSRAPDPWAIRLRYERHRLMGAVAGPGLREDILRELIGRIEELRGPQEQVVGRTILFASMPVRGALRVGDLLQILPAPPNAPRPPFVMGDHPFVVEFIYQASPVAWVGSFRFAKAASECALLLNALAHGGVKWAAGRPIHRWTYLPDPDSTIRSEFLQEGYFVPEFTEQVANFSPAHEHRDVPLRRDAEYYSQLGITPSEEFAIAESFPRLVAAFHALDATARAQFLRAAYWYGHYYSAWNISISLAYVCMISAIEALMPDPEGGANCASCGRSVAPGPTKRFTDFLEELVPSHSEPDRRARKELYRTRSKLTHGGALLRVDLEREAFLNPAGSAELALVYGTAHLTQAALVNWLSRH